MRHLGFYLNYSRHTREHWTQCHITVSWFIMTSCYWHFVRETTNHRWTPPPGTHKDQIRGALMFSLICAWTKGWAKNRAAGDLRCHRDHCDVTLMSSHEGFVSLNSNVYHDISCSMFHEAIHHLYDPQTFPLFILEGLWRYFAFTGRRGFSSTVDSGNLLSPNKPVSQMRVPLVARLEPAGTPNRPPNVLYVLEYKTLYILIHALHTRPVAFWHMCNMPPMIS